SRFSTHQQSLNDPKDISLLEALPDYRPDPEQLCETAELTRILRESIDQLSPPFRRVAHICLLDGLNPTEAADMLGIPLGTLKAQLFRARAQIAQTVRKTLSLQFVELR